MTDPSPFAPDSETFASLLEREHVSAERVDRIVADVGEQVAALHAFGLVHGAIHPETVLIGPDGSASLLDADVARGVRAAGRPLDADPDVLAPTAADDLDALEELRDAGLPGIPPAAAAGAEHPGRRIGTGAAVLVGTAGIGLSVALIGTAAAGLADIAAAPRSAESASTRPGLDSIPAPGLTLAPGALSDPGDDGQDDPGSSSTSESDSSSDDTMQGASQQRSAAPSSGSGGSSPVDAGRSTPSASPSPTATPTSRPSSRPERTKRPSPSPTATSPSPTTTAVPVPTATATPQPTPTVTTPAPTAAPTASPTPAPTADPAPTTQPTTAPTASPEPTATPQPVPTSTPQPTAEPTSAPAPTASAVPSASPTASPTAGAAAD